MSTATKKPPTKKPKGPKPPPPPGKGIIGHPSRPDVELVALAEQVADAFDLPAARVVPHQPVTLTRARSIEIAAVDVPRLLAAAGRECDRPGGHMPTPAAAAEPVAGLTVAAILAELRRRSSRLMFTHQHDLGVELDDVARWIENGGGNVEPAAASPAPSHTAEPAAKPSPRSPLESAIAAALVAELRRRADENRKEANRRDVDPLVAADVYTPTAKALDDAAGWVAGVAGRNDASPAALVAELRRRAERFATLSNGRRGGRIAAELQTLIYWLESGTAERTVAAQLSLKRKGSSK